MRAGDIGEVGCMTIGSHQLVVRNLDTGGTPLTIGPSPTTVYEPWEWSPDGTQFVFKQQEATDCDQLSPDRWVTWVVSNFGAPTRVSDLAALHRQWYGDKLFTADCGSADEPVIDRWGDSTWRCDPRAEVTLRVGGQAAGTAVGPQPVGVITP